jgi:non-heme chloroperoxidase
MSFEFSRLTLTLCQTGRSGLQIQKGALAMTDRRTFLAHAAAAMGTAMLPRAAQAETARTRIRTRDATEIYVKEWSRSGRPVIFTHAWPLSADIWDDEALALSQAGYRVIAYDRRGFGRSGKPASGYDFDTFADDLADIVSELEIKDAALVGYSMGGGEVVRYFSRHQGRGIAKAGFVGAAASYLVKTSDNPDGIDAAVFEGIKDGVRKDRPGYLAGLLKDVFFDTARPATNPVTPNMLQHWLDVALEASLEATIACVDAFNATDFRPELASVQVPALVLHGTADIPVPIALGRATARGIPGAKLIEYDGVSHGLVVTEKDRVTRDLMSFLAG